MQPCGITALPLIQTGTVSSFKSEGLFMGGLQRQPGILRCRIESSAPKPPQERLPMGDQLQALDQVRSTAIDLGMKFGPKLVVAILILVAGYVAGRWAAGVADRMLAHFHLDPPVRKLIERAVQVLVIGLFAIMALQNLGV